MTNLFFYYFFIVGMFDIITRVDNFSLIVLEGSDFARSCVEGKDVDKTTAADVVDGGGDGRCAGSRSVASCRRNVPLPSAS